MVSEQQQKHHQRFLSDPLGDAPAGLAGRAASFSFKSTHTAMLLSQSLNMDGLCTSGLCRFWNDDHALSPNSNALAH
jgi:hypothetical protein